ncbi:hypothetical protein J056_002330 [Wallemia ichthyophaga EXF-994]|uniref:Uncharacterized protein n=1 Tax=Wallemia ichthyophaga (strain EXF-994 / CBS 113033) TaxID=1299270 RepID=R9AGL8_WALI9|nr:uncharacterized protein J056_002330 [Wallemia ichthyophaga EXF-994]EOQ99205.1 hypothetical protein J056_002330 [Wallemia ichthyophaga EXF-994]
MFDDLHKPQLHGVVDTARKIYASGGIPGFFKGYSTVFVRAFPTNAISLATWTYIMHALSN